MDSFPVDNPYGAPCYRVERTGSTMEEARSLAAADAQSGTVIIADFQERGRGRVAGRIWTSDPGDSLLCTLILRYPSMTEMPTALPLRVGLAATEALEELEPELRGRVQIKWPNDVVLEGRKLCGILCESDGRVVYVGTGFNLAQRRFPPELSTKASSVVLERRDDPDRDPPDRIVLLNSYLRRLKDILEDASSSSGSAQGGSPRWFTELNRRLYRRGDRVRFEAGAADSGIVLDGILESVGSAGELRIRVDGEASPRAFASGELLVYI